MLALGAETDRFYQSPFDFEPGFARGLPQLAVLHIRWGLGDLVAGSADQEGWCVVFAGMGAGHEGVQPLDPVDEALFRQKLQRAIGDRGLRAHPLFAKDVENLIGSNGAMLLQQDLQNEAAERCKLHACGAAVFIGCSQNIAEAMGVIVGVETDGVHFLSCGEV